MQPDHILRSDLLDILFEGRNKAYGAYDLRKHYANHLYKALGGMLLVGMLVVGLAFIPKKHATVDLAGPIIDIPVVLIQPPPPHPPVEPPPPPKPRPRAATIQNVVPEIVKEIEHSDVPEQTDLDKAIISTKTHDGTPTEGDGPVPDGNATTSPAAPVPPPMEKAPEILNTAEVMPQFPGGMSALQRWLSRNLRPQEDQEPGQRIKVLVRFAVTKSGEIDRIQLVQTGGEPYDNEVLRVMHKMPKWEAGRQQGQAVAVWYSIPIIFEMPEQ